MATTMDPLTTGPPDVPEKQGEMVALDFVVLAVYFVFVLAVGLASLFRSNRGNAQGYFLAGSSMIWFPVGASLFASNIGSEHFIGLAGSGAASGIAVAAFELNALALCQVLGWIFLPVYLASGVYTMPEYVHKRFGGQRLRMYIAVLSLALYIFTKISVDLYSGAVFIQQSLGWDLYISILSLLAITALYTVTGGLAAVIYTDTLQTIIMLVGAFILCIIGFVEVGGMPGLEEQYMDALPYEARELNNTCGLPNEDAFVMMREPTDDELPWPGFLFGQTTASLWYWATDQVIVQRALAAKNLSHGKGGTLMAGLCKITPLFFIVFPGMIARILFPDTVACVDPAICMEKCGVESGCSNLAYPLLVMNLLPMDTVACVDPAICMEKCGVESGCSNLAYPLLVMNLLPMGLRGLMLAVMLSALMSSLTSIFNSGSTIFTMDIWRKLRKIPGDDELEKLDKKSRRKYEWELMVVGRVFVLVLVAVSVLWIPVVQNSQSGQLFHYIQQVSAYFAPPIAATFLLAILWERINETGAFWGNMLGLAIGITRMILDFVFEAPGCGIEDTRPSWIVAILIQYMYFALFLFCWTGLWTVVISLATEPIPSEYLYRLTFWTRFSRKERKDINLWRKYGSPDEETNQLNQENNQSYALDKVKGHNDAVKDDDVTKDAPEPQEIMHSAGNPKKKSRLKSFLAWFCGLDNTTNEEETITEDDKKAREEKQMDKIHETKRNKIILNIGLVIVLAIDVFLYCFWA